MNKIRLCATIATLGPVGYFGASGTVATILSLPLVYFLRGTLLSWTYFVAVICLYVGSIFIIKCALQHIRRHDDPSEIVLDEVVATLLVFWSVALHVQSIMVGVLIFRILDIIKFGWVKKAEAWADAWGVLGDDMVAALITNILLRLLF